MLHLSKLVYLHVWLEGNQVPLKKAEQNKIPLNLLGKIQLLDFKQKKKSFI